MRAFPLRSLFAAGLAASIALFCAGAGAQTAHFAGVMTAIGSGFSSPYGVAVDSAGDVFVADSASSSVYEIVAVNGIVSSTSTVNSLGSGFYGPESVAVDSSGNVFVADNGNGMVKEILAAGGYTTVNTLGGGFTFHDPSGVALDSAGNVYVADSFYTSIEEIVASGGYVTVNSLGSGLSPLNVAVDSTGNVFVAEAFGSTVVEMVAAGGYTTVNTVGSGFSYPTGVAVDASGNVFVSDYALNEVEEVVAVNGVVSSSSTVAPVASFSSPWGVALDRYGNLFVASYYASLVDEVEVRPNFGSLAVATGSPATLSLTFTFDTGGTGVTPAVYTQGATGLDFTDAGTGTCTTNGNTYSYSTGDTCTVDVTFSPTLPGLREGAATLTASGATIATGYVSGTGTAPQVTFPPGTFSTINSGFNHASGVAVDGAGDVFVADSFNDAVKEIVAVSGVVSSTSTVNTVGSGFGATDSVAVDGAGDVFVADSTNGAVKEIVAANGAVSSSSTVVTVGSGIVIPYGVAVDRAGDVFVADHGSASVKEIVAVNGTVTSSSAVNTVGSGFSSPVAVAVDSAGDVFVADSGANAVKEIVAVNGAVSSASTVITVGSGFSFPEGVAVDGDGNVFVADQGHNAVKKIVAVSGAVSSTSTVVTIGGGTNGFNYAYGVAVDSRGNLFVADTYNNAVEEIDLVDPPSLSFASTAVGATSSDSPQTVTITNNGNAALTFEVPTSGLNPTLSTGFTFGGSSTCPQLSSSSSTATLAAGASCTALISFEPTTTGSITGSLVETDNALNTTGPSYSTQTIALSGTATLTPPTVTTSVATESLTLGTAATPFTPVTASGGSSPYTYSISPSLPAGMSISPTTGAISGTPTGLSATTTYTVTATDSNGASASATFTLTVNAALAATTAVSSTTLTAGTAATPFTPVTVTGGTAPIVYSVSPALPAGMSISPTTGAISGTPTGLSATTTYTVTATDSNGATASATFTLTVNAGSNGNGNRAATATGFSASPTTQLASNPIVFTAQVTCPTAGTPTGTVSFLDGTTVLATVTLGSNGVATYSDTALAQGSHLLSASYSGDSTHQPSSSAASAVTITVGNLDLNLGGTQTQSVAPGAAVAYNLTLAPVVTATFLYPVTLTASGLPTGATYSFSPASIPAGSGSVPVTLTVQTAKSTARLGLPELPGRANPERGFTALALALVFPLLGARRLRRRLGALPKRLLPLAALALGLGAAAGLNGCGSGGFFGPTSTSGNYTITVTATSGNLVRTTTVQLTIQ